MPEPPPTLETPAAPVVGRGDPAGIWAQVAARLDADNKSVAIMARAAKRFALSDGVLEVGFDSPVFHTALTKPNNLALVTGFLHQVAPGLSLKLTQGGRPVRWSSGAKPCLGMCFRWNKRGPAGWENPRRRNPPGRKSVAAPGCEFVNAPPAPAGRSARPASPSRPGPGTPARYPSRTARPFPPCV